jgi:hypothetical protein
VANDGEQEVNMEPRSTDHTQGRRGDGPQGGAEHLYEQARDAVSGVAERASEMWDDVYDRGERYYREGSRRVSNVDASALAFALIVGVAGYALAYLIHGQQSWQDNRWRHGQEHGGRNRY